MRSKLLVVILAIAIGFLLPFLPIWPRLQETFRLYTDGRCELNQSLVFDSMKIFYLNVLLKMQEGTAMGSTMVINIIFSVINPFVLIFLSWIIASRLQRALIYLWDLP
jgi:hypothetical protein